MVVLKDNLNLMMMMQHGEIDNSRTSLRDKIEGSTSLSVEERLNALRNKQS